MMSGSGAEEKYHLEMPGLSGGNLLGFLAALGTLRCLTIALPEEGVRMSWQRRGTAWRPVLHAANELSQAAIVQALSDYCAPYQKAPDSHPVMLWHNWVPRPTWQRLAGKAGRVDAAYWRQWAAQDADIRSVFAGELAQGGADARAHCDWLTAIGTEGAVADGEDADSALRAARIDYFIGNLVAIIAGTAATHLVKALFKPWAYDDPMDNLSLKFDASEDRRHAHQWYAPSGDPERTKRGNVLGANRLAIEAIPLFPTTLDGIRLATTAFTGARSKREVSWCVWEDPIEMNTARSVLEMAEITREQPNTAQLRKLGIAAVYRCRRETIGKTRIFTPPFQI